MAFLETEQLSSSSEFDSVQVPVMSAITWAACYLMFKLILPKKSPEYNSRLIALVHGSVAAIIGLNQCFLNENPFEHPEWLTSGIQQWLMVFSLGYFVFDLIWCLYYQTETKLMIVHHIYSIFAIRSILCKGRSGAEATCSLGMMEVTNPILQTRWFLRSEGFHKTFLFYFVEVVFLFLFFLIRIVVGTYVVLLVLKEPSQDFNFKILSLFMYVISWLFLVNIVNYLRLKFVICDKRKEGSERVGFVNKDEAKQ